MTVRDLVRNAALELNIVNAEDALEAADAVFILGKFNRIRDRWNARGLSGFTAYFTTYTLTPNLQPHTLGPTGATFVVSSGPRPERLLGMTLIYGSSSRIPLTIRDEQWWLRRSSRTMTGLPSDVYYRPAWPNGELYLWPVPSSALPVEIATDVMVDTNLTLNSTFSMPPGYEDALTLTLAEEIAPAFAATPSPILMGKAADARLMLFSNHGKRYPLGSDFGRGRGWWDYRTGMDR